MLGISRIPLSGDKPDIDSCLPGPSPLQIDTAKRLRFILAKKRSRISQSQLDQCSAPHPAPKPIKLIPHNVAFSAEHCLARSKTHTQKLVEGCDYIDDIIRSLFPQKYCACTHPYTVCFNKRKQKIPPPLETTIVSSPKSEFCHSEQFISLYSSKVAPVMVFVIHHQPFFGCYKNSYMVRRAAFWIIHGTI